jgi:hypothetical protein
VILYGASDVVCKMSRYLLQLYCGLDALGLNHATLEEADPSEEAIVLAKKNPKFGWYAFF